MVIEISEFLRECDVQFGHNLRLLILNPLVSVLGQELIFCIPQPAQMQWHDCFGGENLLRGRLVKQPPDLWTKYLSFFFVHCILENPQRNMAQSKVYSLHWTNFSMPSWRSRFWLYTILLQQCEKIIVTKLLIEGYWRRSAICCDPVRYKESCCLTRIYSRQDNSFVKACSQIFEMEYWEPSLIKPRTRNRFEIHRWWLEVARSRTTFQHKLNFQSCSS